jgi:squalene synthase HpnC
MAVSDHYARCTQLAQEHYENFPVGRLVPPHLKKHVHAVYAFARVADDLADEGYDEPDAPTQEERLASLNHFEDQLQGKAVDPALQWIFEPLAQTAKEFNLPQSLFTDLLSAFKQDVVKRRYASHAEVLDYCRRSANPIGRLVLLLHGYRDPALHLLSDHICTALQLANFWQDVSVDLVKDRIYLPQDEQARFGVTEEQLFGKRCNDAYRALLKFQTDRTWEIFKAGETLPSHLSRKLSWEIRLTWLGGTTILRKIEKQNYDTLNQRPKLSKWDLIRLMPYAWFSR